MDTFHKDLAKLHACASLHSGAASQKSLPCTKAVFFVRAYTHMPEFTHTAICVRTRIAC